MSAYLLARRGLARTQNDGDRAPGCRVVDVDRQEAALVVVGVEKRQILMAMNDVERVVDVKRHAFGRRGIARQPKIEQDLAEADDGAQIRQILDPRAGRLGAQIQTAIRQPPASELEGRIAVQPVEIVGVLVAARDHEDAGAQNVGHGAREPVRITRIADHRGKPLGQAQALLGRGQQQHAAVRGDPFAVERGCDLFASNGWKRERQQRIVGHGGCGWLDAAKRVGSDNRILRHINRLDYTRQPFTRAVMNKMG